MVRGIFVLGLLYSSQILAQATLPGCTEKDLLRQVPRELDVESKCTADMSGTITGSLGYLECSRTWNESLYGSNIVHYNSYKGDFVCTTSAFGTGWKEKKSHLLVYFFYPFYYPLAPGLPVNYEALEPGYVEETKHTFIEKPAVSGTDMKAEIKNATYVRPLTTSGALRLMSQVNKLDQTKTSSSSTGTMKNVLNTRAEGTRWVSETIVNNGGDALKAQLPSIITSGANVVDKGIREFQYISTPKTGPMVDIAQTRTLTIANSASGRCKTVKISGYTGSGYVNNLPLEFGDNYPWLAEADSSVPSCSGAGAGGTR